MRHSVEPKDRSMINQEECIISTVTLDLRPQY